MDLGSEVRSKPLNRRSRTCRKFREKNGNCGNCGKYGKCGNLEEATKIIERRCWTSDGGAGLMIKEGHGRCDEMDN
jgi:hypothetical protein